MPKKRYTMQVECIMLVCATFWISSRNIVQIDSTARFYARYAGAAPAIPLTVTRCVAFYFGLEVMENH